MRKSTKTTKNTQNAPKEEKVEQKQVKAPVQKAPVKPVQKPKVEPKQKQVQIPEFVEDAMKRNPDMELLYVNEKGFVFVAGTSKSMRGNAKLYRNKFYKK